VSVSGCAIHLRQVSVRVGGNTILHDIDLRIDHGECIGILGNNGAGKSTLLKLFTGAVMAHHGEIMVLDQNLRQPLARLERQRLHAQVGQIFQGLNLVARLTALENVLVGGLARNRSLRTWARLFPAVEIERAKKLLQDVGLAMRSHVRADRLSGGERQKVAIARMLLQCPRLILADEPTSALDPVASVAIAQMLSEVAKAKGVTMITVVHEPGLLPLLADRVIGLAAGRIAFDLPVAEITSEKLDALYGKTVQAAADIA